MKRAVLLINLLLITSFFFAVGKQTINEETSGYKVLYISQSSKFKNDVFEKVKEHFEGKDVYLNVIDYKKLDKVTNASIYDKIIIVATVRVGEIPSSVKKFLKSLERIDNVKLYLTSGSGEWESKGINIDAFTCWLKTLYIV